MGLHPETFNHLLPTEEQKADMATVRAAAKAFSDVLEAKLPEGPDKTYLLRKNREVAMWANIAITRLSDGTPRPDPAATPPARE